MDIEQILKMLNCENDTEIQKEGICLAKKVTDLSRLILPPAPPSVLEVCAMVICEKSDEALEPYLRDLMEWLRDLNWPGALLILDRLKKISGNKLKKAFMDCVAAARNEQNLDGDKWLSCLSELLDNEQLKASLPPTIVSELLSLNIR